jgi:hypothetical protein
MARTAPSTLTTSPITFSNVIRLTTNNSSAIPEGGPISQCRKPVKECLTNRFRLSIRIIRKTMRPNSLGTSSNSRNMDIKGKARFRTSLFSHRHNLISVKVSDKTTSLNRLHSQELITAGNKISTQAVWDTRQV